MLRSYEKVAYNIVYRNESITKGQICGIVVCIDRAIERRFVVVGRLM